MPYRYGVLLSTACVLFAGVPLHSGDDCCGTSFKAPDAHAGHAEEQGVVHLNAEKLKMAELELQPVTSGKLAKSLDGPGEIMLNEDKAAHITPRVAGVAVQVLKTVGDKVAAGEVLAVLESPDLGSAKIDYFTARLNLDLARLDMDREQIVHDNTQKLLEILKAAPEPAAIEKQLAGLAIGENKSKLLMAYSALRLARASWVRSQKLLADKVTSQAEYELAAKQFESAEAEYKGAFEDTNFNYRQRLVQMQRALRVAETALQNSERRLHILGVAHAQLAALAAEDDTQVARYELRAPFAGTVIEKHISVGEHLETTSSAFTIADFGSVWCNVRVYPKDLKYVKIGQAARIKLADEDVLLHGTVAVIHPVVSEKTRAAFVRVTLDNSQGQLRPGLFVTGAIVFEEHEAPVVVPVAAIQTLEGQEIVFVAGDAEGEFEAKQIKRGYSDGVTVEIKSGIAAGQKAVVRNSFILKAELAKGEGGHEH